jgi:hypothetical protein
LKAPAYFVETAQQASDVGINPFALTLLAESFADNPERFGDENVILLAHAHNGQEVWFIMTKKRPTLQDFDDRSPAPADERTSHPNGSDSPNSITKE